MDNLLLILLILCFVPAVVGVLLERKDWNKGTGCAYWNRLKRRWKKGTGKAV